MPSSFQDPENSRSLYFAFSKKAWTQDELFFEADLLLGINSFVEKNYINAEKYFERLNKVSRYNFLHPGMCRNF